MLPCWPSTSANSGAEPEDTVLKSTVLYRSYLKTKRQAHQLEHDFRLGLGTQLLHQLPQVRRGQCLIYGISRPPITQQLRQAGMHQGGTLLRVGQGQPLDEARVLGHL